MAGFNLTVSNLREISEDLFTIFNPQAFGRIIRTFHPETTRGLPAYNLHVAQAHPLAVLWHQMQKEIAKSETEGSLMLSDEIDLLVDALTRIKMFVSPAEIPDIIRHLETRSQFFSGLFEANTFANYRQIGANVLALPEDGNPDFVVEFENNKVFIECKSLEDTSRQESQIIWQIENSVIQLMERSNRCWNIELHATRRIVGIDLKPVVSAVRGLIEDGAIGITDICDGMFRVSCAQIAQPDTWYFGIFEHARREDVWVEVEIRTLSNGQYKYKNPRISGVIPFFESDEFTRISGAISKGHSQIPVGHPGILHIELPYADGAKSLDVVDPIFERIYSVLRRKPRLNAVVISSRFIDKFVKDGGASVLQYSVIIPNPEPAISLPDWFSILGSNEEQFDNVSVAKEGWLLVEFSIQVPLGQQLGKSIYFKCERHGKSQFRLWQSFKNCFRVDVVHQDFGRRTFEADLNYLAVDVNHKLAVGYSAEAARVAVNGRMIENIRTK